MIAEIQKHAVAGLTIQEMAAQSGLSEHTLRYYERIGLLTPVPRDNSSGHRRYSPAMIGVVQKLGCLRETGMSIQDLREHLRLMMQGADAAAEQAALFATLEAAIEREIEVMQVRKTYLAGKVAYFQAIVDGDLDRAQTIAETNQDIAKALAKRKRIK